jgi:hypothetical protein
MNQKKVFFMALLASALLLIILLPLGGCATKTPTPPTTTEPTKPEEPTKPVELSKLKLGTKRTLWSTYYKTPELKSGTGSFCLRDKDAKCISGGIRHDQKCFIQMQGSGVIDGKMFAYHSASSRGIPSSDSCAKYGNAWKGSGNVRFYVSEVFKYGKGSFNNPLIPFKSIACPREFKNNHAFLIPDAKGITLPDGSIHNGVFYCHDRGGAIKGNQIDTFLGLIDYSTNWKMFDWNRGAKNNPFTHVKSTKSGTFTAYDILEE